MNATLKSNLLLALVEKLFKNADKLSETSTNEEAVDALFEMKMRLLNELRNLFNACSSEEDIVYLLPEQLKDLAVGLGYVFTESPYYEPTDVVRVSLPLAEKIINSVKEQRILEMLIS
jgi:hypothetical protein